MTRRRCMVVPKRTKDNPRECTCFAVTFILRSRRNRRYGAFCDVHQSVDPDEEKSSPLPARNPVPMRRIPVASGPNLSTVLPVLTIDGFACRFYLNDDSLAALQREVDPIYTADCRKCRDIVRFDSTVLLTSLPPLPNSIPPNLVASRR
jgi:hypothetical protein